MHVLIATHFVSPIAFGPQDSIAPGLNGNNLTLKYMLTCGEVRPNTITSGSNVKAFLARVKGSHGPSAS